jgi:hypothetical protein
MINNDSLIDLVIPDSVTSIGNGEFAGKNLTSVVIPPSVKSIGKDAFANNELTSVVIPDSVTFIGVGTFEGNKLTRVVIPDSVTSIGAEAFEHNELAEVVIGNSVISIGTKAFIHNKLTSVIIPDSVTSIGESAFKWNNLTDVVIGKSVTSIARGGFARNKLTSVVLPHSAELKPSAFDPNVEIISGDEEMLRQLKANASTNALTKPMRLSDGGLLQDDPEKLQKLTEEEKQQILYVFNDLGIFSDEDSDSEYITEYDILMKQKHEEFKNYLLEDNTPDNIQSLLEMCDDYIKDKETHEGPFSALALVSMYDMWLNESPMWEDIRDMNDCFYIGLELPDISRFGFTDDIKIHVLISNKKAIIYKIIEENPEVSEVIGYLEFEYDEYLSSVYKNTWAIIEDKVRVNSVDKTMEFGQLLYYTLICNGFTIVSSGVQYDNVRKLWKLLSQNFSDVCIDVYDIKKRVLLKSNHIIKNIDSDNLDDEYGTDLDDYQINIRFIAYLCNKQTME